MADRSPRRTSLRPTALTPCGPAEPADSVTVPADVLPRGFGFDGDHWLEQLRRAHREPAAPLGRLGSFELLEEISRGGQGVVYKAYQPSTRRTVAVKRLLQSSVATPAAQARFEREVEAAAALGHPNIVTVYGVEIVDGQPLLAMEWVDGLPLDRWWKQKGACPAEPSRPAVRPSSTAEAARHGPRTTVRRPGGRIAGRDPRAVDVLAVFLKICAALQHAHQRGVIHRDLKPGNILVDRNGEPRVVDFGLAKLVRPDDSEMARLTHTQDFLGTPAYAAPEQVRAEHAEIDVRTDVYALGVMLYELLTGVPPYSPTRGLAELFEVIQHREPPAPSSQNHRLDRELDAIVLKALAKESPRRYQSVDALAEDLRRYLAQEPVLAHPPSTLYQLRKLVRKHRAGFVIAGGFMILLLAATLVSGTLYVRAEAQRAVAEKRRLETEQVADFQEGMLAQVDPTTAGLRLTEDVIRRYTAALERLGVPEAERAAQVDAFRQQWLRVNATDAALSLIDETILRPAVKAIDRFKDQPVVEAQLRHVLAERYHELGLYGQALSCQQAALEIRNRALGEEHPDTLMSINNMGTLLQAAGKFAEAEQYFREALRKHRSVLGEKHPNALRSINNMGALLQAQGKLAEAEPYYREVLNIRRRVLGEDHPDTLCSINSMGALFHEQGKLSEAEPYWRETLEKRRRLLGEEHPDTLSSIDNLGFLLLAQGKPAEAEPYFREALEKFRRVLGDEHPDTLKAINNMGFLLQAQGRLAEAEPHWRESLEKRRRVLGEEHPDTLSSINNMGALLHAQGKLSEAEPYWRAVLEKSRRLLGEEHPDTLISINNLGALLWAQGKLAEAEPYLREALEKRRYVRGEQHPETIQSLNNLAFLLEAQGKFAETELYWKEALEKNRRVNGEQHRSTLNFTAHLSRLLQKEGKHQEAIDLLTPAEPAARKAFTAGNASRLAAFLTTLGLARAGLGYDAERFKLAESNLLEAHPILVSARGETNKETLACGQGLVDLYSAWHVAEPGKGYDAQAAEWQAKLARWQATRPATP